jgi:hypothetical protein
MILLVVLHLNALMVVHRRGGGEGKDKLWERSREGEMDIPCSIPSR